MTLKEAIEDMERELRGAMACVDIPFTNTVDMDERRFNEIRRYDEAKIEMGKRHLVAVKALIVEMDIFHVESMIRGKATGKQDAQ